jgi:hypothetical protein
MEWEKMWRKCEFEARTTSDIKFECVISFAEFARRLHCWNK